MENRNAMNPTATSVLIAEDSPTQAAQLQFLLEENGFEVSVARNGREALEMVRASPPGIVISDIVMPELDGYGLCKAIKSDKQLNSVPVILVTSLDSMQDIAKGLACGADNFIRKPYEAKTLLGRIDYILLNQRLRRSGQTRVGIEIYFGGEKHFITSEREQILDLLISSYEQAIEVNEELKLREQQIGALNVALGNRAEELEIANNDLESFGYSVSHDLRAPLRAVCGFCEILREDYSGVLDTEGRRLLGVVNDSAAKMEQMIDDLLNFSRLGRRPIVGSQIDVPALVQDVLEELRRNPEHRKAEIRIDPLPPAWGDGSLIRQVWINLMSNALKYSSRRDVPRIEVTAASEGAMRVYCIRDNGAGFDMRQHDRLFEVFQRAHRAADFPGNGVGLAIVQRIIRRHGGRVWAQSEVDKGASFYFSLPASATE
jgi:signal transduction histidine kinase